MSELADYRKRNSKTFSLEDGESAIVVYKGYKIGPNRYDNEKESVYYTLETDYGPKIFQSGALALTRIFENIAKDTQIRITRKGEGNKTTYLVEKQIEGQWVKADFADHVEE